MPKPSTKITFSSCFYIVNSKFDKDIYILWIHNLFTVIKQNKDSCNLVFYTDETALSYIKERILFEPTDNIKIIIKPVSTFYTYKYKREWIRNHIHNELLIETNWQLNMIWSEKIAFVKDTIDKNYFHTEWYSWCDAGYFRNRSIDLPTYFLKSNWPNITVVNTLSKHKIGYGCVFPQSFNDLIPIINDKNEFGLPREPIPQNQVSISGGFFIIHRNKINWWATTYYKRLELYFEHNYLVKDDQIILVDCIVNNMSNFSLCIENNPHYDAWFMFQRILCKSQEGILSPIVNPPQPIIEDTVVQTTVNNGMVSILMPIYNGIEFINESVASILKQTYDNWELLIGINGHPENSYVYKIAKQYEDFCNKIRVIDFHMYKSKSSTLNAMLPLCKADYVAILDVDDIWEHGKLMAQKPYMYTYDVIGTKCVYFGESKPIIPNIPVGNISSFNFLTANPIINSSSLIRKELCHWEEIFAVEDYNLWLSLWVQDKKFFNVNEVLVQHRIHSSSSFNSKNSKNELEHILTKHANIMKERATNK